MYQRRLLAVLLLFALAILFPVNMTAQKKAVPPDPDDLTEKIEKLGNPYSARYGESRGFRYARNIWVMFVYKDKIYLGGGNSSNGGPGVGAGPVPIIALDPKTKRFQTEWSVPDEQIDVYRVFSDGLLYIPGHDPQEDWKLGNFYRKKEDGSWEKVRTMPDGVHNYDMAEFDGRIFSAGYGIYGSTNRGARMFKVGETFGRAYSFLPFKNALFAVAGIGLKLKNKSAKGNSFDGARVAAYNKSRHEFEQIILSTNDVLPKTRAREDATTQGKIVRPTPYKNMVFYIGGHEHNDHQIKPIGAYCATASGKHFKAKRIDLSKDAIPWDIKVVGNQVFILFEETEKQDGKTVNRVWRSTDGKKFSPLLSFRAGTFARSFAYYDGFFYFGLGTEIAESGSFKGNTLILKWDEKELSDECGDILRIPFDLK